MSFYKKLFSAKDPSNKQVAKITNPELENAEINPPIGKVAEDDFHNAEIRKKESLDLAKKVLDGLPSIAILVLARRMMSRVEPMLLKVAPKSYEVYGFLIEIRGLDAVLTGNKRNTEGLNTDGRYMSNQFLSSRIGLVKVTAVLLQQYKHLTKDEIVNYMITIWTSVYEIYQFLVNNDANMTNMLTNAYKRDCEILLSMPNLTGDSLFFPEVLGDIWTPHSPVN